MLIMVGMPFVIMLIIEAMCLQRFNSFTIFVLIKSIEIIVVFALLASASKVIADKIDSLTNLIENFCADNNEEISVKLINSKDGFGELSKSIIYLEEYLRKHALLIKKLLDGDFSEEYFSNYDNTTMDKDLESIRKALQQLVDLTSKEEKSFEEGKLIDDFGSLKLRGGFDVLIQNINNSILKREEKIAWYQGIIDAIPYQVQVRDIDVNSIYMNKKMENTLRDGGLLTDRETFYGNRLCGSYLQVPCNSADCPDTCDIMRLINEDISESSFQDGDEYYKLTTSFMKDKNDQVIGYIGVNTNITSIMAVNEYTKIELTRLEKNLKRLASGELEFDVSLENENEYTTEIKAQFQTIIENLMIVELSMDNLIEDTVRLTHAVVEGDLTKRVDETSYDGKWKELISGMNSILVEIEKPLVEYSNTMKAISIGDLQTTVTGDYQGVFERLKQIINETSNQLNTMIKMIAEKIESIAIGNLDIENIQKYPGDFELITNSINIIIESLNEIMGDIHVTAQQVHIESQQLSDGSQSLSQGSTEQASSIQQLTAAIAEISDQTKRNALAADKVRNLTLVVQNNALTGNEQMRAMQTSMEDINISSKNVSKIIKVIDEIAFQTNILALNAAVEAARAGQHGKGFSVVAEEVRTLAARSAEAAKETTNLIEGTIDKVQNGTQIANETVVALNQIVTGIEDVADLIENIAEASNEQAMNILQINKGIEQVAQVVQHNSATAQQSAAASEQLSGHAEMLEDRITQFNLKRY